MKETDLKKVKEMTKIIAETLVPTDDIGIGIAIHPFVDSVVWFERLMKGTYSEKDCNLCDIKIYQQWLTAFYKRIDKCSTLSQIYMFWRDPWKLTFMKYCGEFLSEKDFAEYLADAWVVEENPNMDANVSRKECIKMFKSCKKEYLMTTEDLNYYNNLAEELTIYRGVGINRIALGLSWTDNKEKAEWFRDRWNELGTGETKMLMATVNKKNVIAYFNTRGEEEILLDVFACKKDIKEI